MKPWEKYQNSKPWVKYDEGQEVFNPEALAQIEEGNRAYEQRQQDNRPWLDKSPVGRLAVAAMQGVANAGLNPAGYVARAAGMNTKPFQPQNAPERVSELFGQYGYDAATIAAGLGGMAQAGVGGTGVAGNVIKSMAEGGIPAAETLSLGSAFATGTIDPKNPYMRMATDTVGGMFVPSVSRGIGTVGGLFRSNVKKGMDYIRKTKGDAYLQNMIDEATQKGVSLAEVADERGLDMVQMARQQTPDAKYIIHDNIRAIKDARTAKANQYIDDTFGKGSGLATVEDVKSKAIEQAQPYYEGLNGRDFDPNYKPESKVNISGKLSKEQADELLKSEMQKVAGEVPTKEQLAKQNFDRWFEGSKIVDENGQPLKLYHGTLENFDEFSKAKIGSRHSQDDLGFYLTNRKNIADDYALSEFDPDKKGNVISAYVNSKKPLKIDNEWAKKNGLGSVFDREDSISFWDNYQEFVKDEIKKAKADGVIVDDGYQKMVVAFEPNQIKSVNNSGGWSSSADLYDRNWNPKNTQLNIISDTPKPQTTGIGEYVNKNPFIKNEISNVRKDLTWSEGVRNAPDTSFDILNAVKKNIDDKINVAKRAGNNEEMARLVNIKNELVGKMDAVAPEYAEARKIYENAYRFEDAADLGRDILGKGLEQRPERFSAKFAKLSDNEKEAVRAGFWDDLRAKINTVNNPDIGWKSTLNPYAQRKIKMILGEQEGNRLIDFAKMRVKSTDNLNAMHGGSTTANNQTLRDKGIKAVRDLVTGKIESFLPSNNARNMGIARIMTNPSADLARATYEQVASPRGWEAVYQALYNPRGFTRYNTALAAYLAGRELQQ